MRRRGGRNGFLGNLCIRGPCGIHFCSGLFFSKIEVFIEIRFYLSTRFVNSKLDTAKKKLEIVSGAAPPPFRISRRDFLATAGRESGSD